MEHAKMSERQQAREATPDQISVLLHDPREEVTAGLLENPATVELHICLLLGRSDLSWSAVKTITQHKEWIRSYRVRRALAFHPRVPEAAGTAFVRELRPTDLVQLTFSPSANLTLRHLAEEMVLSRLGQLTPAEKVTLARRGPGRVKGALLMNGSQEALATVLDSPLLGENYVLRALSQPSVPGRVVSAIALHPRWMNIYPVRLALLRNAQTPVARVPGLLAGLSVQDLRILSKATSVPASFQPYVRRELQDRLQHGKVFRPGNCKG